MGSTSNAGPGQTKDHSTGYIGLSHPTFAWNTREGHIPGNDVLLHQTTQAADSNNTPAFFELCVNRGKSRIALGELQLVDGRGKKLITGDLELFGS